MVSRLPEGLDDPSKDFCAHALVLSVVDEVSIEVWIPTLRDSLGKFARRCSLDAKGHVFLETVKIDERRLLHKKWYLLAGRFPQFRVATRIPY